MYSRLQGHSLMAVNPRTVRGRRTLQFQSFQDVLRDVEQLAASASLQMLGNWPLPELLNHLTMTMNNSIDGFQVRAPWLIRLLAPLMKRSALKQIRPGIRLPKSAEAMAFPQAVSLATSLQDFRRAIERVSCETMQAPHPAFGSMTHQDWYQLHLRHCEMHLSFAIP